MGKNTLLWTLLLALCAGSASAASLETVASGFEGPIFVTSDPADPDRLFVVERRGTIQLIENGQLRPFADLSSLVDPKVEGGLLSIALSPDFRTSGRLFVFYTGTRVIHVAELVASGSVAPLSSLRELLTIEHPNHDNHYAGQLQFGPEGNLFISTGDGGGPGDPEENAQDLTSQLGKILRINPNPSVSLPYTVPPGTPSPRPPVLTRPSGATACATPSAFPSTASPEISGSATSARTAGRRSTSPPRPASAAVPTTVGTARRDPSKEPSLLPRPAARPPPASSIPGSSIRTRPAAP